MRGNALCTGIVVGFLVSFSGFCTQAIAQSPDHPVITEVYSDPPGADDGPVGRDPTNLHQSFIEIYLPPASELNSALLPQKDALKLTFYDVEGDSSSSGNTLVNYRIDLPPFDLDLVSDPIPLAGSIARPSSGVVVIGWVDYLNNPPTDLLGTPSTRRALINGVGGVTSVSGFEFIALNGAQFAGTTNFPTPLAVSLVNMPNEATSGIIQNGSGAYLLVNRDDIGYIELYDDKDTAHVPPTSNASPSLATGTVLGLSSLLDAFASNDHSVFDVIEQPYVAPTGDDIDLEATLPFGGPFSLVTPQVGETDGRQPVPGKANGYARVFVDVPKKTKVSGTASNCWDSNGNTIGDAEEDLNNDDLFDARDCLIDDALNAYRHIRNSGPFFPTPGSVVHVASSPAVLSVALASEQMTEVLKQTTGRPGLLSANVGGGTLASITATPGASSNPSVATFGSGNDALNVASQAFGFPSVGVTPDALAAHGAVASATVSLTSPANPIQMTTITATVIDPTTGLDSNLAPFQTTVFAAVQTVPAQAGVPNEFVNTDLGAYVMANLGGLAQETLAHGAALADPFTDINNGFFVQTALIKDFPPEPCGGFQEPVCTPINFPAPVGFPGKLDLLQTVQQSAEELDNGTYTANIDPVNGLRAIRLNVPDTKTFDGPFSPSEQIQFVDAIGGVGDPRSGLSNATTTRTFELAIIDSNVKDNSTLETGATDDFGIIIEVQDTEPGSPVVDGEFVFLSFTGGLQGADVDTLDIEPHNNVANIIYLDLDNLKTVLKINSIEQIFVMDTGGGGELDVIELFSLNPVNVPTGAIATPLPATGYPHESPKNRYISFTPDPQTAGLAHGYQVTHVGSGQSWYTSTPRSTPPSILGLGMTYLVSDTAPPLFNFGSLSVVNVGGCLIAPNETYEVRATTDGISFTAPLVVSTTPTPANFRWWADVVGVFSVAGDLSTIPPTPASSWAPADSVMNGFDITATLRGFQGVDAPHVAWVDLSPAIPDRVANGNDVLQAVNAFAVGTGREFYPFDGPTAPGPQGQGLCPAPPLESAIAQ